MPKDKPGRMAKEEPVTIEQMAAMNFEPWKHVADEWSPPSNKKWADDASFVLPPVRIAWILMYQTKAELENIVETLEDEPFDEMVNGISDAKKFFEGFARVLAGAEGRLLCAASSVGVRQNSLKS